MKRLSKQKEIEALQNALKHYNFDEKYFILPNDGRLPTKYAIAVKLEHGGIECETNYMTYEAFNAFLFGYDAAVTDKLIKKETIQILKTL